MNRGNQKIKLYVSLFLALLMGIFVPVSQGFLRGSLGGEIQAKTSVPKPVSAQVVVNIIQAAPLAAVVSTSKKAADISCQSAGLANSQSFIQSQATINFNQPASCYKIGFASPVSAPAIAVQELARPQVKIVVANMPAQGFNILKHWPASQAEFPALPLASFILTAIFLFLSDRKLKKINYKPVITYFTPNSFMLCPMRC